MGWRIASNFLVLSQLRSVSSVTPIILAACLIVRYFLFITHIIDTFVHICKVVFCAYNSPMNISNALGALLPRHQEDFFLKASRLCLMALAFLLPIWFLPVTNAPVEFNKVLLVSVFVILSFGFYLIDSILRGRVAVGFHWIFIAMGAVLATWLASSLVSGAGPVSLWGAGAEPNR